MLTAVVCSGRNLPQALKGQCDPMSRDGVRGRRRQTEQHWAPVSFKGAEPSSSTYADIRIDRRNGATGGGPARWPRDRRPAPSPQAQQLYFIGLIAPRGPQIPIYGTQSALVVRMIELHERGILGEVAERFERLQEPELRIDIVRDILAGADGGHRAPARRLRVHQAPGPPGSRTDRRMELTAPAPRGQPRRPHEPRTLVDGQQQLEVAAESSASRGGRHRMLALPRR